MIHPSDSQFIKAALDRAITSSKKWSGVAHKTFVEMAEKNREKIVNHGDFSFIRQFREQFGIREQTQAINDKTLETQFIIMMQPIEEHFLKLENEREKTNKRDYYLQMLRSGQKDEFIAIMRMVQTECSGKRRANPCALCPEADLTQEVWQTFHKEEEVKKQQEEMLRQQEIRKQQQNIQMQYRIEEEAKRRIEREVFESAVLAKVEEMKRAR